MADGPIPAGTRIGHVHLKVSDLERAIRFYRDIMGFELVTRLGDEAAFLSAGGYHHHIGLNTWTSRGGAPPARGTTGLYHFAINYPTTPRVRTWPSPSNACWRGAGPLTAPPITGPTRLSTSTIPTSSASSSLGIGVGASGPGRVIG